MTADSGIEGPRKCDSKLAQFWLLLEAQELCLAREYILVSSSWSSEVVPAARDRKCGMLCRAVSINSPENPTVSLRIWLPSIPGDCFCAEDLDMSNDRKMRRFRSDSFSKQPVLQNFAGVESVDTDLADVCFAVGLALFLLADLFRDWLVTEDGLVLPPLVVWAGMQVVMGEALVIDSVKAGSIFDSITSGMCGEK